jgi:hypothetical protein
MNELIIPELDEGENHIFFDYNLSNFDDKVYHAKSNLELTKQLFRKWKIIRKNETPKEEELKSLAGDLKEEYYYRSGMDIPFSYIENFIKVNLERGFDREILEISFCRKGSDKPDLWLNVMHRYEHNPSHSHIGLFSFVWYLDIPEEIRQECYNQKSNGKTRGTIQFDSNRTNIHFNLNPKTADVFIFESGHKHQVYPFYTDNERYSMAGNVHSITFKDGETITS